MPRVALLSLALVTLVTATSARAEDKGLFGVGLIVGDPSGISAKYYLSDDTAIDAAVGVGLIKTGIHAHSDFLWHPAVLESQEKFVMPLYFGPGVRVLIEDQDRETDQVLHLGLRIVVGVLFDFRTIPLDVFIEGAPIVEWKFTSLEDEAGFGLGINVAGGVRYYF